MAEISFEVKQDSLAVIQNTAIEANFDEVKAALTEMIEPYKNMIVTEDGIAYAKADRAKIRKVAARVDDVRKAVKKAYTAPLSDFEAKCKELVAVCDEGSGNLDNQIKAFEQAEADAKIAEIKEYYFSVGNDDMREFCPWERIYADKWRNKGVSADMAKGAIDGAFEIVSHDLAAIREMGGDDTTYLLDVYKQTHDLSSVIFKASELKTAREREEQRRLAAQQAAQDLTHARQAAQEKREQAVQERLEETTPKIELVTVDFRVTCTRTALNQLGEYMRHNGIKYGRVTD